MEALPVGELPPGEDEPTDEDADDVRETKLEEVVPFGGFPPVDARHWEYQSLTKLHWAPATQHVVPDHPMPPHWPLKAYVSNDTDGTQHAQHSYNNAAQFC